MTALEKHVRGIVAEEVARFCATYPAGRPKYRRCLRCHEPFRLRRDSQVYCGKQCARRAHYLPFNVREIRKGLARGRREVKTYAQRERRARHRARV